MEPRHLKIILRWLWLLILIPIITSSIAIGYNLTRPPVYRAIARLIIGPGISSPNPDSKALQTGALLTQTYTELANGDSFKQSVIDDLHLNMTVAQFTKIVTLNPIIDTQITEVEVDYKNKDTAIAIANRVADGIVAMSPELNVLVDSIREQADRIKQDIINIEAHRDELVKQLETETDPTQRAVISQRIVDEEQRLASTNSTLANIYTTLQSPFTNQVEIVDRARDTIKNDTNLPLTAVIAIAAGLVISAMIAVLFIFLDMLLVDYESIRRYVDYPLWGRVKLNAENRLQNFRMLSTYFTYQHNENNIRSILLTGIEGSEHVASIASDLAITLSQIGKRVLLVDADFSNSVIEERFGIESGVSLVDVLTKDLIQSNVRPQADYPNLVVIPSGESSPDSFFLIASPRLSKILGQLEGIADYVIVSAPAMSRFEQSMAMAGWADGGVIIAQQGKTRIADLRKAIEYLESVGGKVLGMVVSE